MIKKILKFLFILSIAIIFSKQQLVFAQESTDSAIVTQQYQETSTENLEAIVDKIISQELVSLPGIEEDQLSQKLELLVTKGSLQGKRITVQTNLVPSTNTPEYELNDKVVITRFYVEGDDDMYVISDFVRREPLLILFLIFIAVAIFVAKQKGIMSLASMAISFAIIFFFVLKQIFNGADAVAVSIVASLILVPIMFSLSHGVNKKSIAAMIGTLLSLGITILLSKIFLQATHLTGMTNEEAGFLQVIKADQINLQGLLLAGIIIGALGVLDDVAISQAAIVFQLKETNKNLKFKDLYKKAMEIGKDHIASMINTLILVYAGAALPLLLLFMDSSVSFSQLINYELIAEEIVRTLVASIGLMLAVPITTIIAAISTKR